MSLPCEIIQTILRDPIGLIPADNFDYFFRLRDERYSDAITQLKTASLLNKRWNAVASPSLWKLALVELRSQNDLRKLRRVQSVWSLIRHLHVVFDGGFRGLRAHEIVQLLTHKEPTIGNLLSMRWTSFDVYIAEQSWSEIDLSASHDCLSSIKEATFRFRTRLDNLAFLPELLDTMPHIRLLELAFHEPVYINDGLVFNGPRLAHLRKVRVLMPAATFCPADVLEALLDPRTLCRLQSICVGRSVLTGATQTALYERELRRLSTFATEQLIINDAPRRLSDVQITTATWLQNSLFPSADLFGDHCAVDGAEFRSFDLPTTEQLNSFLVALSRTWSGRTWRAHATIIYTRGSEKDLQALQAVAAELEVNLKLERYDPGSWRYRAEECFFFQ